MSITYIAPLPPAGWDTLRKRAVSRLQHGQTATAAASPSAALEVLYEMATAPDTAPAALAVLHELQVHQVELELQAEELQRANAELEAALRRQTELHDALPVGCYVVDRNSVLQEANLHGALLLLADREGLPGRSLCRFFAPSSARLLLARLAELSRAGRAEPFALELLPHGDALARRVRAALSTDPGCGGNFLVALVPEDDTRAA